MITNGDIQDFQCIKPMGKGDNDYITMIMITTMIIIIIIIIKEKYLANNQAAMFRKGLNFPKTLQPKNEAPTIQAQKTKEKTKQHAKEQIKKRWEEKPQATQSWCVTSEVCT